jgi:hypothetical protein
MSNTLIRAAFETRLATWAAAQTPAIPIAYENVTFVAPATRYLRSFLLPADSASLTLDRLHREYLGVYQVSIVMPLNTGAGAGQALVSALEALFPPATPLVQGGLSILILNPMSAGSAIQEPDRYVIPVSCSYRADTF